MSGNAGTPSQRNLRSTSNSTNITLQDIKSLIESSKSEIINKLNSDMHKLTGMVADVIKRVDDLDKKNNQLEDRCQVLERKLEDFQKRQVDLNRTNAGSQHNNTEELLQELEDRRRRRDYLIASGLPESSTGTVDERLESDKAALKDICCRLDLTQVYPEDLRRIGRIHPTRPRLLRFKCSNHESRTVLLRRCRSLRNSSILPNVFINPDLTFLQRTQNKAFRAELQQRRNVGETVTIKRGQIIDKAKQSFH